MFAFLVYQTFPAALFEMLGVGVMLPGLGKGRGGRAVEGRANFCNYRKSLTLSHTNAVAVAGAATPTLMGTAAVSVVSHSHCRSLPHTHAHTQCTERAAMFDFSLYM